MDKWLMCVVALILGMLMFHMLKGVCGCKTVEGQDSAPAPTIWELSKQMDAAVVAGAAKEREDRIAKYQGRGGICSENADCTSIPGGRCATFPPKVDDTPIRGLGGGFNTCLYDKDYINQSYVDIHANDPPASCKCNDDSTNDCTIDAVAAGWSGDQWCNAAAEGPEGPTQILCSDWTVNGCTWHEADKRAGALDTYVSKAEDNSDRDNWTVYDLTPATSDSAIPTRAMQNTTKGSKYYGPMYYADTLRLASAGTGAADSMPVAVRK